MRKFKIDQASAGVRVDLFISEKTPEFSRSSMADLFEQGKVLINDKSVRTSYKLKVGDVVAVDDSALRAKAPMISLPIIYEDDNVVVINKPAGVLTHSKGAGNSEATVASFIESRLSKDMPSSNRAGIVHRLDRATSGVIICAKNLETSLMLQKQFSQRRTKKIYTAIVEGIPEPAEAIIDAPIERNPRKPQTFRVGANGKPASTTYKVEKILNPPKADISFAVVRLQPATGRTHQLRVHLKYIGHPIVGDRVYGKPGELMYLHATSLELTLPGGDRRVFSAPLPEYFKKYANNPE